MAIVQGDALSFLGPTNYGAIAAGLDASRNYNQFIGTGGLSTTNTSALVSEDPLSIHADGSWNGVVNQFIGHEAGASNIIGSLNGFIGPFAGRKNVTGTQNLFVGPFAGEQNTVGFHNAFLGVGASQNSTNSRYTVAVGTDAMLNSRSSTNSTSVGGMAGMYHSGGNSVFVGTSSGLAATNTQLTTAVGFGSLSGSDGSLITALGAKSGFNAAASNVSSCVFLGAYSGMESTNTLAANSIAIGNGVTITKSNQVRLGSGIEEYEGTNWKINSANGWNIVSSLCKWNAGKTNTLMASNGRVALNASSSSIARFQINEDSYLSPRPLSEPPSATNMIAWGLSGGAYLVSGLNSSGTAWFQSRNAAAGQPAYDISLNPLAGDVGVGTIAPTNKLQVIGDIHAETTVYANALSISNNATIGGTTTGSTVNTATPAFKSLGTNNVILRCPDGGSFILRIDDAGTLSTVTNSANL